MSILPANQHDFTLDKSLPANIEVEKTLLGAILLNNAVMPQAKESIAEPDFFLQSHRRIYAKMLTIWQQGLPIDPLSLQERLRIAGELDQCGGPAYIASLFDGVPRFSNIEGYTRIIKQKSMLRQLIHESNRAMQAAFDAEESAEDIAARAKQQFEIISQGVSTEPHSQKISVLMERAYNPCARPRTVPTGFPGVDSLLRGGGFSVGSLNIIAARTSRGKSTLAMQIAGNVASHFDIAGDLTDCPVVQFFSIEMSGEDLALRVASIRAEIPWESVQRGEYTAEEHERLTAVREQADYWQLYVSDIRRLTPRDIVRECKARRRRSGRLGLVVIDYAGLVQTTGMRFSNRNEEIAWLMRELKIMAGELEVPFIVPVQINREGGKGEDILLHHLKESGSIEESADFVGIMQEPKLRDVLHDGYGLRLTIDKQRMGVKGQVSFRFHDTYGGFTELPNSAQRGLTRAKGRPAADAGDDGDEF